MSTRLNLFCNRIIEAGWLVALVVVPLHFNPASSRIFEPDKIALLRSIAVIMTLAWAIKAGAAWLLRKTGPRGEAAPSSGPPRPAAGQSLARHPLALTAGLVLVAAVVSTALSILPHISLWGYYGRLQGLYTTAAYLVFFFSVLALLRTPEQMQRLITTALLASVPVAVYSIAQQAGVDPLGWVTPSPGRARSTMGNPVFTAATLAMIVPLTLYGLLEAGRKRRAWRAGGYLAVLAIQLAGILFTQSRGPVLGLAAGLLLGGVLWMLAQRKARAAKIILAGSLTLTALLVLLNLPGASRTIGQDVPYLTRLTRIADAQGSAQGRVLIWDGAVDLITADPKGLAVGYGPETIRFAYYPFYSAELGRIVGWRDFPDRMHNETFDVLVTTGLLGFIVYLLLFTGIVYYGLRWTGLMPSSRWRTGFLAAWGGGGGVAVLGVGVAAQTWAFSGAALPFGLLGGLFCYLAGCALYASRSAHRAEEPAFSPGYRLLTLLLLSGILAHFVETNVGIAVSATRLLFWIYTALFIVLGVVVRSLPEPAGVAEKARDKAARSSAKPRKQKRSREKAPVAQHPPKGSTAAMLLLAGFVAVSAAFGFVEKDAGDVAQLHLLLYYLVVLLVLGTVAFLLGRNALASARKTSPWGLALASVMTLGAVGLAYTTNVQGIQASLHHLKARTAFQQRDYDEALSRYRRALDLDPGQELYQLEFAQLLATQAHYRTETAATRDSLFRTAERILQAAATRNPFEQYHPAALADVYRLWARSTPDADGRAARYEQAMTAFDQALRINAENVLIWRQWAAAYEDAGDRPQAIDTYRRVLAWDSTNAALYARLGALYRAEQQDVPAVKMYEAALRHIRQPRPDIYQALALLYRRLERLDEAVRASEQAVALNPDAPAHHDVLIDLYERLGRCREALAQTRAALRRWPEGRGLQARAARLTQQCGEQPGPP